MAKELRLTDVMVGDWVDVRKDAAPKTPHLEQITPSHMLRDEHWYGIELTPEILEKNRIYKHKFAGHIEECYSLYANPLTNEQLIFWEESDRFELVLRHIVDNLTYSALRCKIYYVHELQHALKLCGINKDIQL